MVAKLGAFWLMLVLGGCAGLPDWSLFAPARDPGSAAADVMAAGEFDFGWRLSGDPEVAPLQVFDNGRRMWLQFAPGQAVPAVFARTDGGDRLVNYRREGAYIALDQVWPRLLLRGGRQQSQIDRIDHAPESSGHAAGSGADAAGSVAQAPASTETMAISGLEPAPSGPLPSMSPAAPAAHPPAAAQGGALRAPTVSVSFDKAAFAEASPAVPVLAIATARYEVSPRDQNMRLALSRWAGLAGWTFEPEHWSVDADIPIAGAAQFDVDFKQAVQALMAATELADRPLQPCFYSNKVLRIVPYAQACNRVASLSGDS